jgi:hypothetical protein
MHNERYWPVDAAEVEPKVSLLNEPIREVIPLRPIQQRSLHAVLCEALTNTQALLTRLEAGVCVPKDAQREIVRLLYVSTRHQVKALIATLECEGLE